MGDFMQSITAEENIKPLKIIGVKLLGQTFGSNFWVKLLGQR